MSIFDELDKILFETKGEDVDETPEPEKPKTKPIPINPEMETSDQGIDKAGEKIAKYFYNLSVNGGGGGMPMRDDTIDLPDDWLAPKFKGKISGKIQDKTFEKNKVVWDPEELERLSKEIELDLEGSEEDEFDDFDYRDNDFGDDADTDDLDTSDMDSSGGGGSSDDSSKSEKEKLNDAINDAINRLRDEKNSGSSGDDSGQQSGGQESGGQQSGGQESGGQQSGGQQSGGQQSGGQQSGGQPSGGGKDSSGGGMSEKDRRLTELADSIAKGDSEGASKAMGELKEGDDGSGSLAGEHTSEISDDAFKKDMEKAGFSKEEIEEMQKIKDEIEEDGESPENIEDLKRKVIDGLEKKCGKRGGSALAKTIVRQAMRAKIDNDEWKEMLEIFLKGKSLMKGDNNKSKTRSAYGNKNHLWRGAVLPTKTYGKGEIQKIYAFVDFSGSVNQDLVYTFLGRVIDLCQKLSYTDVVVYGFGDHIVLPRKINGKMLKTQGKDVVLAQTWDYISSQNPGGGTENFEDVSNEIVEIRRKDRDSVFLIFGDALWYNPTKGPMCLKNICGEKVLDDICALTYYTSLDSRYSGMIAELRELVGLKHVITTKASSIKD